MSRLRNTLLCVLATCKIGGSARNSLQVAGGLPLLIDKLGSLLQTHGAGDAKMLDNVRALAETTPGVGDSMNEALRTVIDEIEKNVMEKIKGGHKETQHALDLAQASLKTPSREAESQKKAADDNDRAWFECVAEEKTLLQKAEDAYEAQEEARSNQDAPCQNQVDSAPFSTSESISGFECDFSQEDSCGAALGAFTSTIETMVSDLEDEVGEKEALYATAKQECDAAKQDVAEKQSAHDEAIHAYKLQAQACAKKHELRQLSMCLYGSTKQRKCAHSSAYNHLLDEIGSSGSSYSESDRLKEWNTATLTVCMLEKVKEGSPLDESALAACDEAKTYDRYVGVLSKSERFPDCSPDAISFFNGQAWETPTTDLPSSTDYDRVSFLPKFAVAEEEAPFDFCSTHTKVIACEWVGHATHRECVLNKEGTCYGKVKYGHGATWTPWKEVSGKFICSNKLFGDPLRGQAKECICDESGQTATSLSKQPPGNGRGDQWNLADVWDNGVPTGNMNATVAEGVRVTCNSDSTPSYTGTLTMKADSYLRLAWTSRDKEIARAVSSAQRIVMEGGSSIVSNLRAQIDFPPITLAGDAAVAMPSTGSHGSKYSFKAIDGSHKFSMTGCHRCLYDFNEPSSMSEMFVTVIGTNTIHARVPGAFGQGDVSLNLGPTHGQVLNLFLDAPDTIAESATLSLTSISSRFGQGVVQITVADGVTQTVSGLVLDGERVQPGSYTAASQSSIKFLGGGKLVVKA